MTDLWTRWHDLTWRRLLTREVQRQQDRADHSAWLARLR